MFGKLFKSNSDHRNTETQRVSETTSAVGKALEKYYEDFKEAMESQKRGSALMEVVLEYIIAFASGNINKLPDAKHMVERLADVFMTDFYHHGKENPEVEKLVAEIRQNLDNPAALIPMVPRLNVLAEMPKVIEAPEVSIFS